MIHSVQFLPSDNDFHMISGGNDPFFSRGDIIPAKNLFMRPILSTLATIALLGLANLACLSSQPGPALNAHLANPRADSQIVPVHFATNRTPLTTQAACSDEYYGVRNLREIMFGTCEINVPKIHTVGELDTSRSAFADANRYFKPGTHTERVRGNWLQSVAADPGDEVLLFVHGFNVKFEEAVLRAAQLAYDSKFQGSTVLYTWPAGASGTAGSLFINTTYRENQVHARDSVPLFAELLRDLAGTGKTIHVVVHSMGHQIVLPALAKLAAENGKARLVGELVLNAPDFPGEELFELAPRIRPLTRRITLYCSPGDNALVASQRMNGNFRAGLCMKIPGVDVINVNELDTSTLGHGYYSGRAVLVDLFQVLLGVDAPRRLFIRRSDSDGGEDYILRK